MTVSFCQAEPRKLTQMTKRLFSGDIMKKEKPHCIIDGCDGSPVIVAIIKGTELKKDINLYSCEDKKHLRVFKDIIKINEIEGRDVELKPINNNVFIFR